MKRNVFVASTILLALLCGVLLLGVGIDPPPPVPDDAPLLDHDAERALYDDVFHRIATLPGVAMNNGYVQWNRYVIFFVVHYPTRNANIYEDLLYVYEWDGDGWVFVERWRWRTFTGCGKEAQ